MRGAPLCLCFAAALACDRGAAASPPSPEESTPQASAPGSDPAPDGEGNPGASAEPELPPPPTPAQAGTCPSKDNKEVGLLVSPRNPVAGQPLRIVAATFEGETGLALRVDAKDGAEIPAELTYRTGVPASTIAAIANPTAGTFKAVVGRDGTGLACKTIKVAKSRGAGRPRKAEDNGVWPIKRKWSAAQEALYSTWVRELFHAERGDDLAFKALHEVTSQRERNVLHNHYGWSEDDSSTKVGLYLRPDCADAPYFLRSYFAWKRQLPFAFRQCSRGKGKAPKCGGTRGVVGKPSNPPDTRKPGELGAVQRYFSRTLAWGVHSGNGRTAYGDDRTDFYPLVLSRRTLRPGAIFADPYGHIFVLVEMFPANGRTPGVLYAIDGQPDGSITRKRFWEGNFLWNPDPALGGSGFKAFRPADVEKGAEGRRIALATDSEIAKRQGYGDVGDEQSKLKADEFYDLMDGLISPGRRDAFAAQAEAVRALSEAAKVRVTSVNNGEEHVKKGGSVSMPSGHAIFETTGAWENYSTPARDLRLLIAIDLVNGFDAKVARNADVFTEPGQDMDALRQQLKAARDKLLADPALAFEYTRSDGSKWRLTVAELIERAKHLEVGYNPNDCPEIRWAAPKGSDERKPCRRRAPAAQQRKMAAYRSWFQERRRPARGDPGPPVE